jgi:hypothetical protein
MTLELALAFLSLSSSKGLLKLFNLHHHVGWCLYSLYPLNVAYIDWIWNYTLEGFLVYLLLVWSLEAIFIAWPQALLGHSLSMIHYIEKCTSIKFWLNFHWYQFYNIPHKNKHTNIYTNVLSQIHDACIILIRLI